MNNLEYSDNLDSIEKGLYQISTSINLKNFSDGSFISELTTQYGYNKIEYLKEKNE